MKGITGQEQKKETRTMDDVIIDPCFSKRAMKRIERFHQNCSNVERIAELFTVLEKVFWDRACE